jgi:hypothetical protein
VRNQQPSQAAGALRHRTDRGGALERGTAFAPGECSLLLGGE